MAAHKYDIPYALKPKKGGASGAKDGSRRKKSRYSTYIDDQDNLMNRMLATPGRKLLTYVIFFTIFGYVFISALRSSKNAEHVSYELDSDLAYSNSRESILIDDAIDDNDNNKKEPDEEVTIEVPRKSIQKVKGSKSNFDKELDELVSSGNEQLNNKKTRGKPNIKPNVGADLVPEDEKEVDGDLIADMQELEAESAHGSGSRRANKAFKGQKAN